MERSEDEFWGFQLGNVGEKSGFPGRFGGGRVVMGGGGHGAEEVGETANGPGSYL